MIMISGADKEIRTAITSPTPVNELAAWKALIPLVLKLKDCYDFSKELCSVVTRIIDILCSCHGREE